MIYLIPLSKNIKIGYFIFTFQSLAFSFSWQSPQADSQCNDFSASAPTIKTLGMACACKHTETAKIMKEMPTDEKWYGTTYIADGRANWYKYFGTLTESTRTAPYAHPLTSHCSLQYLSPESLHQKPITTQMFITARIDKLSSIHTMKYHSVTRMINLQLPHMWMNLTNSVD